MYAEKWGQKKKKQISGRFNQSWPLTKTDQYNKKYENSILYIFQGRQPNMFNFWEEKRKIEKINRYLERAKKNPSMLC